MEAAEHRPGEQGGDGTQRPSTGLRRWRRPLAILVGASLVAIAVGVAGVVGRSRDQSPLEVAQEFLDARRAGDCERIVDLVSPASLAAHDVSGPDELRRLCPDVVDGYAPEPHEGEPLLGEADVDESGGSTAAADVGVRDGGLVQEHGAWKVELGDGFSLGRTPEQTVWGYVEAYREGDCAAMADHLSGQADDFVSRCEEEIAGLGERPAITVEVDPVDEDDPELLEELPPTSERERLVQVVSDVRSPLVSFTFDEVVRLVEGGLEWKLDGTTEPGRPLGAVAAYEAVVTQLVDGAAVGEGESFLGVDDAEEARFAFGAATGYESALERDGFRYLVRRTFLLASDGSSGGHGVVTIVQLPDAEAAAEHAESVADAVFTWWPHRERVEVPGLDGAQGITASGLGSFVVVAHDSTVVVVQVERWADELVPDDLARATEIARAQLGRI